MTEKKMDVEQLLWLVHLAENAERYDDMKDYMRQLVIEKKGAVTFDERNLLSLAYKHVMDAVRYAYRSIHALEKKELPDDLNKGVVADYRNAIRKKLADLCTELLKLLDTHILPSATADDMKIYFLKMQGDYVRYMAEGKKADPDFGQIVEKGCHTYQQAHDLALQKMGPIDPTRLGLALNFSVFYYDIAGATDKAIQLAKQAYDDAVVEMDKVADKSEHKDSVLTIYLLRENLALWNVIDLGSHGETSAEQAANGTTGETKIDSTPAKPKSTEETKKMDSTSVKRSKSPSLEKALKSSEPEKNPKEETMKLGGASGQQQD